MSESDMDVYDSIERNLNDSVTGSPVLTVTLNASNESSITADQEKDCTVFLFVFYGVVIGLLCLMGLAGNTVSMIVLQKDHSNRVAAFLLQCLALADSFVLFVSVIVLVIFHGWIVFYHPQNDTVAVIKAYLKVYVEPFGYVAQTLTIWTTVLLAVNRYIAVCCPFIAYRLCTMKNALIQVGTVVFVSVAFNIPRFFQFRLTLKNQTTSTEETSIGEKSLFGRVYTNALYTILVLVVPLVILSVLNTKIIKEMHSLQRRQSMMSRSSSSTSEDRAEKNITIVMVIIIIIFLCCHLPDRVIQILKHTSLPQGCNTFFFYAFHICNFLVIFNSSINFVIYYVVRKRFRRILLGLLRCHQEQREKPMAQENSFRALMRSTSRCSKC